ncbi:MAG TPA: amidohydrolase family protein [Acidimicrobiales bacterium]|nr:amidohydrolase family protein [Acidimicrobiales bacterium]
MPAHTIALRGGRVIDPASMLDANMNVGITGATITAVTEAPLDAATTIDASGLVIAPGFIDLHSHAQTLAGRRLQAHDGVTTAFELEIGRSPVGNAYAYEASFGSPINYGFSASWASARMRVLTGRVNDGGVKSAFAVLGDAAWRAPCPPQQLSRVLAVISEDLSRGAIGIGLLLGYAPEIDPSEYLQVARLASESGVPTFTHCRDLVEMQPATKIDGAEEIVRAAAETGAHMHYCHINSTSGRHIDRVLDLVESCQQAGSRITTEAYPYGSGSTAIGAAFLAPERLPERGLTPQRITYLPTGETLADVARLRELRAGDPDGLVFTETLNENDPGELAILRRSLIFDNTIIASDAMPLVPTSAEFDPFQWPLGPGAVTHPRSAGCFSRALRIWREEGRPLSDVVRRCTLLPAQVLEPSCSAMRAKGRIQPGADADLVVFDPARVTDEASYEHTTLPSSGIPYLLVAGVFVIRDGQLVPEARPGRLIRADRAYDGTVPQSEGVAGA